MVTEESSQRFGAAVARAAEDGDYEPVAHVLLDIVEEQAAAISELVEMVDGVLNRLQALERQQTTSAPRAPARRRAAASS